MAKAQQIADTASAVGEQPKQPEPVPATENPTAGTIIASTDSEVLAESSEPATATVTAAAPEASELVQESDGAGAAQADAAQSATAAPAADPSSSSGSKSKPSAPVIPVSEEALVAASAAVAAHHSSPEKPQPATHDRPPPETPQSVKTMTGVAEGFKDPQDASKQSAADIVAAAVADSAPSAHRFEVLTT